MDGRDRIGREGWEEKGGMGRQEWEGRDGKEGMG